ncbi:MAG: MFS transporter, partial [Bacteroidetes bacterium]|nr:MFS transporter [Bacteroidota bacterium]
MITTLKEYTKLDRSLLNIISVEFFVQLINVLFVAILPLYMKKEGYSDAQYAHFTSYRYFGMLALALFLGMYIKGRKILPMIYIASIGVPLFALLIIIGVQYHSTSILLIAHLLWGTAYTFIQIPILPYIMRNAPKEQQTKAITLNFATWSMATITGSLIVAVFNGINPIIFSERNLLFVLSLFCFSGIYFAMKISKHEYVPAIKKRRTNLKDYDWTIITKALVPTIIIAIGAGFTIPFMSLFFSNVHNMSTAMFSTLNMLTAISVTIVAIYIPKIKDKYGYHRTIPTTQSIAIFALMIMATTQYYSQYSFAIIIASAFYLIRQPFMSAAVPMTSEITMKYVGEGNRE